MSFSQFLLWAVVALVLLPLICLLKKDEGRLSRRVFFTFLFAALIFLGVIFVPGIVIWVGARSGDAEEKFKLARWDMGYYFGPDRAAAAQWVYEAAEKNHAPAMYTLALMLRNAEWHPYLIKHYPQMSDWKYASEELLYTCEQLGVEPLAVSDQEYFAELLPKWQQNLPLKIGKN